MKCTFIGLGVMGYPMAGHLQKNGHEVTVYNRNEMRAQEWVKEFGGSHATTPGKAAAGSEIVFMCVGADEDVRAVVYGDDGALAALADGAILVDHTTASAILARELDEATRAAGKHFLDAPVSGGQAGAENGALTVMVGGEQGNFDKAQPVIDSYARRVRLLGPAGSGQLCKMVNQVCIAGLVQGLSEGINLAVKSGLDAKAVIDVISAGAAQSWQMENRAETMIDDKFDFGFAVDWMRKDLRYALAEARNCDARMPVTALVDQFYAQIQERGGGRWDTSSLLRLLTKP